MAVKKKPIEKITCLKCGKEQVTSNYYSTTDTEFFPTGKLHVCKTCCMQNIEENGFESFKSLLRLINKPLYADLYKDDEKEYIKNINSLPQYKKVVFTDSDFLEAVRNVNNLSKAKAKTLTEDELKMSQEFWGIGKSEEEYIWLNTEFIDYTSRYKTENSKTMEDYIAEICLTRLDIRNKRNDGKDVDKQVKMLNDLMTAAGIKPVQENQSVGAEQDVFGLWIKKIENERPISDPAPEWADVDGIRKYIRAFLLHPLLKLFGKDKENPFYEEVIEELDKYTVKPPKKDDD